jgi:peptide/nickel transport system permease protein
VTAADAQRFREDLGLDKSGVEQYTTWFGNFVQGDLGTSLKTGLPVWPDLKTAIWNTMQLGIFAWGISVILGITIGTISAVRQYSWFDGAATGLSFFGLSIPPFFFGLILQIVLVLQFQVWFGDTPFFTSRMNSPGQDGLFTWDRLMHLILPALTVAVQSVAVYSRYMRASTLEVLNSDYLRTARAKGISERRVILRHAMRNSLIPLTTFAAIDIGAIVSGLVITEQIFEWPGMGRYFLTSFSDGDYVQILPWITIVVLSVIVLNLIADLMYGVLDPRIRLG